MILKWMKYTAIGAGGADEETRGQGHDDCQGKEPEDSVPFATAGPRPCTAERGRQTCQASPCDPTALPAVGARRRRHGLLLDARCELGSQRLGAQ